MQRIKLIVTPYSFAKPWIGAELFAIKVLDGWDVYFPHALGTASQGEGAPKNVWFHGYDRVQLMPAILRADKPRYTLVPSLITEGEKVWAKLEPIERKDALDCPNCAFDTHVNECHRSPPCSTHTRPDKRDVIFVTAVEKW